MTDDGRRVTGDRLSATEDGRPMTDPVPSPQSPPPGPQSPVSGPSADATVPGPRSPVPQYKFQSLQVYQLALGYLDTIYKLAHNLPQSEKFNLRSQIERAATSVVLNIAEGSTGQSDPEQNRFISMALRSYLETVACLDIAFRRKYVSEADIQAVREPGHQLFVKLSALRRSLSAPVPRPRSPVS